MGFFSNLFEPKKKEPAITGRTENINTLFGFVEDSPSIAPRRRQAAPEADVGPGSFLQETFTATAGPRTREQSQRNIRRNLLKDTFKPKDLPDLPVERPIDKTQDDLEAAALTANMFAPKDKDVFKRIGSAFTGATHSTVARPVKGITAGFLDASESILAFSQWSKKKTGGLVGLGIPGIGGSKLTDITVSTVKDKANAWKEAIEPEDSDFLDALAGGAGSSLLFFIPGLGISKWAQVVGKVSPKIAMFFGQSTSAFLESAVESGSVLEEAKALGANEKEADIAATRSFTANMLVNFLGNRFGILGGEGKTVLRTALRNMTSEGLQEFVQQIINNDSLNSTGKVQLELDDGAYEAGAIGAILGPILGSAGGGTVRPPSGTTKPKGKAPEVAAKETPATRLQRSVNEGKDFAQLELQQMAKEGIISENRLAFLTPSENIRGGIEDIKRGKAKDASIKLTDNEMRTHLQQFKPVYRDAIEQTFSRGGKNNLTDRILELRSQLNELSPNKLEFKRVEKEFLRLSEVRTRFEDARAAKSITFNPLPKDSVPSKEVIGEQRKAGLRGEEKPKKPTPKEAEAISRVKEVFTPTEDLTLSPADKTAAKKKGGVLNNIITKFAKRMASEQKGQFILDELSNKGVSPQELNDKFWKNTYDSVSPDIQKKIQGMLKSEIGFEPGDVMGVDKKGGKIIAQNWKDVGLVMDVGDNAALLEGTERGYVSIIAEASARFSKDVVEKKPVVQPKSKEEILKLVTPTKDLTLSPADKAAAKKFEETLPKEVKEKLDATRKSRQRPAQLATLKDLKDLEKDMVRAGAAKEQIAEVRKQINNVRANLEPSIKAVRREVTTQRKRAETAERRIKALTKKLQKLPPSKRLELGIEVSPTLLPEPKSQLKESIQKEIKDQEDAQGTFIQYEENIAPIGDRADIDVRVAMPEVLDAAPKLKDISSLRAGFSDLFRNFQRVFKGDLFKVANNKILRPFKESKRNNVEFQEKILKDLKENVVDKLGIRKKSKESKAVQQWGEGLRSRESLVAEFGEKGAKKIEKADDWFRKKYDDLLDEMNTVRKRIYPKNPEKLVLRRADYYRHFRELSDGLSSLGRALATNAAISPELAGISEFTKPKSKFLSLAMPRFGFKTKVDAVGGFLNYLPAASYAIHIDPHTQVFRALGKNLADATQETKNLNNFIEFLHDFSNDLAGKTNPMDRAITKWFPGGRKGIRVLEWVNNRVKANIILGNLSSSVAQLFNIPLGIARAGITNSVRGVQMTMAQVVRLSNIQKQSPFIKERYFRTSYDKFDRGMLKSTKKFAVWTTRVLDEAGTKFIWNASYSKGIQDKVTNPIEFADEMTRRAVAGRGIGELPLAQKSIVTQIVAPFQVEVGNANLEILDILGEKKFGQFATLIIVSYLMNSVAEVLRGSRVVYDPIDAVVDGLMSNDDDEGVIERISKFTGRQIGEILSNVPFGQTLAALYPEYGMQIAGKSMPSRRGLFGEGDPTRFGGGLLIAGSISDPIFKLLLPFGGVQLQKTIKGGRALLEKEVRSKSGKSRLFKVEDDITSVFQALAFGPYSLPESREYFGNETLLDLFFPKPKKAKGLKKIKAGFKGFKGIKTGFKD